MLKRLSEVTQKFSTAVVDNRILKADIETLRTKVHTFYSFIFCKPFKFMILSVFIRDMFFALITL